MGRADAMTGRHVIRRISAVLALACITVSALASGGAATAHAAPGSHARLVGFLRPPTDARHSVRAAGSAQPLLTYGGGPVMLSSRLFLIFWGAPGDFATSYQGSITQWAKDLAAATGRTTNEFSVGSLYYETNPTRFITKTITFGGVLSDTHPFPANGCTNPNNPGGVCLGDGQLQVEIAREIAAQHWPTDPVSAPVEQYLLFTPDGVDSCQDPTGTSCTFSASGFCAYHSSIPIGNNAVVYSNMPYLSGCDSGQAPSGVAGNADADGTIDSAIHEIVESSTDPGTDGNTAWTDINGNEIGDKCTAPVVNTPPTIYGTPLGGSLAANTAFNQLINTHTYYSQMLWANHAKATPASTAAAGCVQRVGPTPDFHAPTTLQHVGHAVAFDGSASYDIVRPITRYAWTYGDGSAVDTTHGAHGSHVYARAGTYHVVLTVSDAGGALEASSETQTVTVGA
jgi:hypothetical protein